MCRFLQVIAPHMSFCRRCKAAARNPGQPPEYTTLDLDSSASPRNDIVKVNEKMVACLREQHLGMTWKTKCRIEEEYLCAQHLGMT